MATKEQLLIRINRILAGMNPLFKEFFRTRYTNDQGVQTLYTYLHALEQWQEWLGAVLLC